MTTLARPVPTTSPTVRDGTRAHVRVAGVLYLVTFAASLPAFALIGSAADPARHTALHWAGLLDVVNALACVGTAVALFPVLRRRHEALALGFVTSRLVEAAIILAGVASLLAAASLHQSGADPSAGQGLVAVRDWTFLLGPGVMPAFNALLLGTALYRSRLVPRVIPAMGLVGAPLLLAAGIATLFSGDPHTSGVAMLAALPIAAWELSVGLWMTVKGFSTGAQS